jgi:hypothetical protein
MRDSDMSDLTPQAASALIGQSVVLLLPVGSDKGSAIRTDRQLHFFDVHAVGFNKLGDLVRAVRMVLSQQRIGAANIHRTQDERWAGVHTNKQAASAVTACPRRWRSPARELTILAPCCAVARRKMAVVTGN